MPRLFLRLVLAALLAEGLLFTLAAKDYESFLKPLFEQNCVKCHGGEKTKGKVNLKEIATKADFLAKPELIKELIEVIDFADMPPEDEEQLSDEEREKTVLLLKDFMRQAVAGAKQDKPRLSRLNRFQYNNSLKDLFRIRTDVFELSEKMMTRHDNYLLSADQKIPDRVRASAKNRPKGFREVRPFPKDLRAAHGFDNQTDQLTLSPLLLDTFLKLSVSILQSPDFNDKTVARQYDKALLKLFRECGNNKNLLTAKLAHYPVKKRKIAIKRLEHPDFQKSRRIKLNQNLF